MPRQNASTADARTRPPSRPVDDKLRPAAPQDAPFAGSLFDWQRELLDFAGRRLRENGETAVALMCCRTPLEAVAVQQAWLRTAVSDYASEGGRLLQSAEAAVGDAAAEAAEATASASAASDQPQAAVRTLSLVTGGLLPPALPGGESGV